MSAHADKKTFRIGVSRKTLEDMMREPSSTNGLLEMIRICIHEMLHIFFPDEDEKSIEVRTNKVFVEGIANMRLD
jgi:hypothetical protein